MKNMTRDEIEQRKKQIVKDIIKKKVKVNGEDKFDPEPEISEKDTLVKT
jgi:septin family protein